MIATAENQGTGSLRDRAVMIRSVFVRNVGLSTILKLSSFLLQFAMLPMLVRSLGRAEYGVWVSLQSLVVWIALLEFGIGKGLRNKLIGLISLSEDDLAKKYISSTFFGQLVLAVGVTGVFAYVLLVLDLPWASWFKSQEGDGAIAVTGFLCLLVLLLNQLLGVTHAIMYAKHWNAATAMVGFFASLGLLIFIAFSVWSGHQVTLPKLAFANLLLFGIASAVEALCVFGLMPKYMPDWRLASWSHFNEIAGLGVRFLFIEFTYLVIFIMDRWIVLQVLGPSSVTEYDILLRLSALVTTGYALCTGPLWGLSGAAWAKRDAVMMDKLWRIASLLMIPFAMAAVLIGIFINPVIHIWVDREITISMIARVSMVLYSWLVIWGSAYAALLNGIGRVREQLFCCLLACLINIPLSLYLCGQDGVGIAGVLIASTFSLSIFSLVAPFVWQDCRNKVRGVE